MPALVGIRRVQGYPGGDEDTGARFTIFGDCLIEILALRVLDSTCHLTLFASNATFRIHENCLHELTPSML
jgi:hypothetical protein